MNGTTYFFDGPATFSEDGRHRYSLGRGLDPIMHPALGGRCLFVMLNPSTADATLDDPTIRRCIGFATRWGYERLDVANIFSLRSTDPKALYQDAEEATGNGSNEGAIRMLARAASLVVCAWGTHGALIGRGARIVEKLRCGGAKPHHLGLTKAGHPKHPLYLRADTQPTEWT